MSKGQIQRRFESELTVSSVLNEKFGPLGTKVAGKVCAHVKAAKLPPHVTEEVLGDLALCFERFEASTVINLNAYCRRVAFNRVARAIKRKARESKKGDVSLEDLTLNPVLAKEDEPCPLEQREENQRNEQVLSLLRTLSREEQRLICLHYLESKSYARIEEMTGIPRSTCHDRVNKALAKLRRRALEVA